MARITPARAGNSLLWIQRGSKSKDHPRACGEQPWCEAWRMLKGGSPPRVRGTAPRTEAAPRTEGITPARAGNRPDAWERRRTLWDHPRACGEQNSLLYYRIALAGSPPRVRGTVVLHSQEQRQIRITPARAGNRRVHQAGRIHTWDHPRACGEQRDASRADGHLLGSPPRVRGTAPAKSFLRLPKRITPARAGNSSTKTSRTEDNQDHPRACGEQRTGWSG